MGGIGRKGGYQIAISSYLHDGSPAITPLASIHRPKHGPNFALASYLPEVDGLHTDGAVPHALEGALLLGGTGFGAREAEALGTRPAERPRGIAESKASVVEEAETHARRHGDICDVIRVVRGKKDGCP